MACRQDRDGAPADLLSPPVAGGTGGRWAMVVAVISCLALVALCTVGLRPETEREGRRVETERAAGDPTASTSRYTAVAPVRVLDSRAPLGLIGPLPGGVAVRLDLSPYVPVGTTAVTMNLTITEASAPLYVTAWPSGGAMPASSSANAAGAGATVANLTTVAVGDDRAVQVLASAPTHLLADLAGYYTPASTSAAGRFVSVTPRRVVDTRDRGWPVGDTDIRVPIDAAGVPAGADAVVANVTAVDATRPGYVSAYPDPAQRPTVSNLNLVTQHQTIANQVIVKTLGGGFSVYVAGQAHIVVDIVGYFTSSTDAVSDDGLFVPLPPARIVDTRDGLGTTVLGPTPAGHAVTFVSAGRGGVNGAMAAAVLFNLTVTEPDAAGYVSAYGETVRPYVSNINIGQPGDTMPNQVIASQGSGAINVYTSMGAQVIVDVAGYFVRSATAGTLYSHSATGAYRFMAFATGLASNAGQAVRWNPCIPITYRVNTSGGPGFALADIQAAVADVSAATGISFVYQGPTTWNAYNSTFPPFDAGTDLVIAFGDASNHSQLAGNVLGIGGPWTLTRNGLPTEYVQGMVLLNKDKAFTSGLGGGLSLRGVVDHELGHALGLAHADLNSQRMFATIMSWHTQPYYSGDQQGLALLGVASGCVGSGAMSVMSGSLAGTTPDRTDRTGEDLGEPTIIVD